MSREFIEWVEIDVDQCTLTYGQGACTAALSSENGSKCYNGYKTCQDLDNYDLGTITYTYCKPQMRLPYKVGVFPVLDDVTTISGMVNVAGADDDLNSLGSRETLTFTMTDFPDHDRYTDKYAQERVTGAAQFDGVGVSPEGSHFGKLRARWPYYAGRAARYCYGYIDNGVLSGVVKHHYILTNMVVDAVGNYAEFEAKDILHLVDNDKAVAPSPSGGELLYDITDTETEITLTPENVGDEYPTEGRAVIGNEIIDYTRSGDVVTITSRGVSGTEIASHSAEDSFQTVFTKALERVDDVIYDLLVNYGGVNPAFCPIHKWEPEITRWAASMRLTVDITSPTGVNELIGELAVLGLSIWWDSQLQEIGLRVNRPPDEGTVLQLSDDRNILEDGISIDDRDEDRVTQISFYSSIIDPTDSDTSADNFYRFRPIVDADAQSENEFNDVAIKEIFCRWLGEGNDSLVRILSMRLLNRLRWSPSWYNLKIRYDQDIRLVDVIEVTSRVEQDVHGRSNPRLMQVIQLTHDIPNFEASIVAQTFQHDQRYGNITENTRPDYIASTDAQRKAGTYIADPITKKMSNGDQAYKII